MCSGVCVCASLLLWLLLCPIRPVFLYIHISVYIYIYIYLPVPVSIILAVLFASLSLALLFFRIFVSASFFRHRRHPESRILS